MNTSCLETIAATLLSADAAATEKIIEPLVEGTPWRVAVVAIAYATTLWLSGDVVRRVAIRRAGSGPPPEPTDADRERLLQGMIIGKCENIITVTFVLAGQETGLALIFAAKSLVRRDDIQRDPGYFLGGTLVNLVFALAVSFVARVLVAGL